MAPSRDGAREFLAVVREFPPEVMDEPDNAWRIGGAAKVAWKDAIDELRACAEMHDTRKRG